MTDKFCDRLRQIRLNCNMTQKQVADALNIDRSTYTCYEIGKTEPSMVGLNNLAKIFNIDVKTLLCNDIEQGFSDSVRESDISKTSKLKIYEIDSEEQDLVMRFRLLSESQKKQYLKMISELAQQGLDKD